MLEKPSRAGVKRENQPEAVNPHPLGGGGGGSAGLALCVNGSTITHWCSHDSSYPGRGSESYQKTLGAVIHIRIERPGKLLNCGVFVM